MILDTSFLLDLKDGDADAFDRAVTLYENGVVQRVAMPSVWELHYGAFYRRSRPSASGLDPEGNGRTFG